MSAELAPPPDAVRRPDPWGPMPSGKPKRVTIKLAGTKPRNPGSDYGFPGFTNLEAKRGRQVKRALWRNGVGRRFAAIKARDLLILERIIEASLSLDPVTLKGKARELISAMDRRDGILRAAGLQTQDNAPRTSAEAHAERAERASGVV